MKIAQSLEGTKEATKGTRDYLVEWAHELGGWIGEYYTKDNIPWCGLFVTYVMHKAGYKAYQKGLSAREWLNWGNRCDPKPGAIMVFKRAGGAHVTFCKQISAIANDGWYCLGGNQSDMVNVQRFGQGNFIGSVWPETKKD